MKKGSFKLRKNQSHLKVYVLSEKLDLKSLFYTSLSTFFLLLSEGSKIFFSNTPIVYLYKSSSYSKDLILIP